MSAFVLFDVRDVKDTEKLGQYQSGVLETVNAYGGRYRVLGGQAELIEGSWAIGMPVLIEFPSRAKAEDWYRSDSYRPLLALRREATEGAALLIDGCEHPPKALSPDG
ncbi:DUF1330 domain-containing protein [Primorskyibacter aestuariivivens]|uniref:DUF1330 domain-containing protein n=1 Tax=Primorskyibacter aestuariivivens TaxID=1888912 RepID=UPI00230084BD|nr:DUF1330 domain-containing protein [Primorskyibacter aestuariivivens]MDA7428967.1 DUF1330 domain-containing protein [Primorskyibacter aestuariivivens]